MRTEDIQIYSGKVTETGNSGEDLICVKHASEIILFLDVTSVSVTNPTMVVKLMTKDTIGNKWYLVENFNSISSYHLGSRSNS